MFCVIPLTLPSKSTSGWYVPRSKSSQRIFSLWEMIRGIEI